MSELAFNQNGDPFEIPAGVTGWRVRRMKPRGAPELVYGKDGRPLVLPIESDMDDLREAVGQLGRYRLDPVNDDNKVLESIPAAYIQVVRAERNAVAPVEAVAPRDEADGAVREAMRLNTELAKSVIDQFPAMMTAAAELLRAADGAGIPARAPRLVEADDDEGEEDDAPAPAPGFDLAALIPQLAPLLMALFAGKGGKGIDVAAMLDWRKAAPKASETPTTDRAERAKKTPRESTAKPTAPATSDSTTASDALPPIDPQTMAHFIAIQSALAPEEAALAREVAGELAPAELRAWFDELSKLSVPDAVTKIRALVGGTKTNGGAS